MNRRRRGAKLAGFTLLEILLAVALLAVVFSVTFMTFGVVVQAWRRGTEMSQDLEQGDYVIDQLAMALRSAYYPGAAAAGESYGFWHEDGGEGEGAEDRISWVKLGVALVGEEAVHAESPHRIEFFIDEDADGERGAMVRSWRLMGQPDDFDPERDMEPVLLSRRVVGFDCRAAFEKKDDAIDWLDEWTETNRIPTMVELTLYLRPLDETESAVTVKRVLDIPVAPLSWRRIRADASDGARVRRVPRGQAGAPPRQPIRPTPRVPVMP